MDFMVDEEYYCNVCDYYATQIELIEDYLDEFRTQYQSLFESVDFGENLGMVLVGKSDSFYSTAKGSLTVLLDAMKTQTNDFLDVVAADDVLS